VNTIAEKKLPEEIQYIVDALDDKRGKDITVLDLREVSESIDFFILATAESSLQINALEQHVKEQLKERGFPAKAVEGPSQRWVLIDYGFTIVHIMSPDAREFYDLEGLWADAEQLVVVPS